MKKRLSSLPLQLLIFVVLPLLVLLVVLAFGGVALHQDEMREMLVNHNRQTVTGAAISLSEQLTQRKMALSQFIDTVENEQQAAEMLADSLWLTTFFDEGVLLYASDGTLFATLPHDLQAPDGPPNTPEFVPRFASEANMTQIVVTAVSEDTGLRAVGVVSLDRLTTINLLTSLHNSDSTDVHILSTDNRIIYHSDPAHGVDQTERPSANQPGTHTSEQTDAEGRDVIATTAPIPAAGWTLVHEERWQETLSPLMRYSQAAPLVLVPGLLFAIGAVWFGIQRIVYPLRRLEAQASELAWGDFGAIEREAGGIEEIRRLQATLQHMSQRVQAAQATMHNYIGAITHAQEDERRRLARELHDQTSQALVALDHRQQMLKPYLKDDPAARELLAEIRAMIVDTINDLRRIVRALRPIYLEELGLVPALQTLARDLGQDNMMSVHFEQSGSPKRLTPEHEMALYRITQEALNNAWQHGKASDIWLTVTFEAEHVAVSVRDNGQGFAAPRHATELGATGQQHFGIMGMYERAALIGAHLQVKSELGSGTLVTVRAPIAAPTDDQVG